MPVDWERRLERWLGEGLIEPATVQRIRDFEGTSRGRRGLRWPVVLALSFGSLLIGAGVLLFVSAHWDALSPAQRMSVVVGQVALFHLGGAWFTDRFPGLSSALHALGTIALGGGIALAGQIFNLAEHWPSGILVWTLGAAAGWWLLKDWPQLTLTALLVPAWLASEWHVKLGGRHPDLLAAFLLLMAFSYLSARHPEGDSRGRRALTVIGSVAVLPLALMLVAYEFYWRSLRFQEGTAFFWVLAFLFPLAVAFRLRGSRSWMNGVAALWVLALVGLSHYEAKLVVQLWCALGSIGMVAWGFHEARSERVNLGVAGFGITVLFFYFSSLMDKLERSASLVGLGLLFLGGGWILEKTRRRLIAQVRGGPS